MYAQILSGVEYIHKLGVVHRDLKPENLLLDHNNNIKLVDFGLSNLYKEGQKLKTACGSPCYAAPEMIRGELYFGLGADIWSSGVILYAMICGYLPFEDQNTKKLYQKIIKAEYKLPSFLSENAQDLISNILNPDPATRYTINDIRKHPWYNQVEHQPPYTPPIFLGKEPIPIDAKIIATLEKDHNMEQAKIESEIKRNRFNNTTTTYYLLLKRKERAGIFRMQYNEDIKKIVNRRKTKSPAVLEETKQIDLLDTKISPAPANAPSPAPTSVMSQNKPAQSPVSMSTYKQSPHPQNSPASIVGDHKIDNGSPNMMVNGIQTVTVVSPINQGKKLPLKPKTSENVNIVNIKKQAGKKVAQAPLTLQVDMVNRNTVTPSVQEELVEQH